jgi:hypothetical protein
MRHQTGKTPENSGKAHAEGGGQWDSGTEVEELPDA